MASSLKDPVNEKEKLGGQLEDDDKQAITDAVKETLDWLDEHLGPRGVEGPLSALPRRAPTRKSTREGVNCGEGKHVEKLGRMF